MVGVAGTAYQGGGVAGLAAERCARNGLPAPGQPPLRVTDVASRDVRCYFGRDVSHDVLARCPLDNVCTVKAVVHSIPTENPRREIYVIDRVLKAEPARDMPSWHPGG